MNIIKSTVLILLLVNVNLFAQSNTNQANQVQMELTVEEGINNLSWESNREVNTSHYLVERSLDGENYETIGQLKAGSSTYSKKRYQFEDIAESNDLVSYRLKLVFMDGRTKTVIQEMPTQTSLMEITHKPE